MSFEGKVILITGASSGIGADAARHLAKLGGKVSIVGRNEKRLSGVADEIKAAGSTAPLVIVADITTDSQRIIDETIRHFGQLDVLINNAGIVAHNTTVENFDVNEFDRIFNTNVKSLAILTSLAVPHLEKTKGNIVNVSSIAGLKAIPSVLIYCMSKATLDQFTKCCALDLAAKGIRVNSINPAVIRTPIFQTIGVSVEQAEIEFESFKKKYPVGRVGEVADTSAAISFLASDAASFLTGVILPVCGGSMVGLMESA